MLYWDFDKIDKMVKISRETEPNAVLAISNCIPSMNFCQEPENFVADG